MLTSLLRWWKEGRPLPIPVSQSTSQFHNHTQCGNNDKNPDTCRLVFLSTVLVSLMGDPVVMLSLYPDFPLAVLSSFASCGEFVFLLDCSGSMSSPLNRSKTNETRIASARVLSRLVRHRTFISQSVALMFSFALRILCCCC